MKPYKRPRIAQLYKPPKSDLETIRTFIKSGMGGQGVADYLVDALPPIERFRYFLLGMGITADPNLVLYAAKAVGLGVSVDTLKMGIDSDSVVLEVIEVTEAKPIYPQNGMISVTIKANVMGVRSKTRGEKPKQHVFKSWVLSILDHARLYVSADAPILFERK